MKTSKKLLLILSLGASPALLGQNPQPSTVQAPCLPPQAPKAKFQPPAWLQKQITAQQNRLKAKTGIDANANQPIQNAVKVPPPCKAPTLPPTAPTKAQTN